MVGSIGPSLPLPSSTFQPQKQAETAQTQPDTTQSDSPPDSAQPSSEIVNTSPQQQTPNVLTTGGAATGGQELTEEEEKVVRELKETDQKVRAHEQAHKSVAGPYAGPISYETVTGPDGGQYAVAGHVDIDVSPVSGNPSATIQKMEVVIRAALAPAEPSPEDMNVARQAQNVKIQAQRELQEQREQEREGSENNNGVLSAKNLNKIDIQNAIESFRNTQNLSESGNTPRETLFSTDA